MCSFSQATKLHRLRSADTDVQTKNSESTELLLYIHLELIADSSSVVFASLLSVQTTTGLMQTAVILATGRSAELLLHSPGLPSSW